MNLSAAFHRSAMGVAGTLVVCAAHAAPPAAPQVTVGAGEVRQLRFDWDYVPRANYYELWFKANDGATEVKMSEYPSWRPRATTSVSLHLLNWSQVRYRVKACNPSGCSATPPIDVSSVLRDAAGFLKSSHPLPYAAFGLISEISEDGNTLAAVAHPEDPQLPGDTYGPVVYVMRKNGDEWQHEARILSGPLDPYSGAGIAIALSADGNRLAIAQPEENRPAGATGRGAVHVHARTPGGWQLEQTIAPPGEQVIGYPQFSNSGDTLFLRSAPATGGREHLYTRSGSAWTRSFTFELAGGHVWENQCWRGALSGDGRVFARGCVLNGVQAVEVFAAPSWARRNRVDLVSVPEVHQPTFINLDDDGDTFSVTLQPFYGAPQPAPRVDIYERSGGAYQRAAAFSQGAWNQPSPHMPNTFGNAQALSSDGKILAVGDSDDDGQGTGVLQPPLQPGGPTAGAVYVYHRRAHGWHLRNIVKHNQAITSPYERGALGSSVSLGLAGKILAAGDPGDDVHVPHPQSPYPATLGADSGAIWIY